MTPERAKKLLPIITAVANGETVQHYSLPHECWVDNDIPQWKTGCEYRIKPKVPEYRLFKWYPGTVVVYTRNHFGCCSADLIHFVDTNKGGTWLTDWLPIPNYNG